MTIKINDQKIGLEYPTYFIADIAANHDGDLERAKALIHLAAQAGADAAKFQNFQAEKIVSDYGFSQMDQQVSHQASWKKSVVEVYRAASIPFEWTPILKKECDRAGIDYFSSPYDREAADMLESHVPAFKAGSGLITWIEFMVYLARKPVPFIMSTGASDISDVARAVRSVRAVNDQVVLMQCNTNYTASPENYDHIHLNVLDSYAQIFPGVVLGLSDHTQGPAVILGAVTKGARVIERHFTDDKDREGPDHKFATDPDEWALMVEETRKLERALGSPDKFVSANEQETKIIQRRCLRAARKIKQGEVITREMIAALRPATPGAVMPYDLEQVLGTRALCDLSFGKEIRWTDLGE
jgi:N-acetylneuraminate synthase